MALYPLLKRERERKSERDYLSMLPEQMQRKTNEKPNLLEHICLSKKWYLIFQLESAFRCVHKELT